MIFKKMDRNELSSTKLAWDKALDELEESTELVRPSLYWSALDAASARVEGALESLQYGLFEAETSSAIALVAVHPVMYGTIPYLKIREIRLHPSLSIEIEKSALGDYFTRHRRITEIIGTILAESLALTVEVFPCSKVKVYGSTTVEFEMFANVVLNSKEIEREWGLKVSTHGHWLQFEKQ